MTGAETPDGMTPDRVLPDNADEIARLRAANERLTRELAEARAQQPATADVLQLLRREHALEWTCLSPSATLQPGTRTGTFRLGTDQLLVDANGQSQISTQDYAVAMIDEVEKPKHLRQRFTVGY